MTMVVRMLGTATVGPSPDRVGEEHQHDHPDVEERGDGAHQHAHDHERPGTALPGSGEDRPLADEAAGQRDAGEGEQEEREDAGDDRRLLAEPRPARQVVRLAAAVADQGHDGERADRGEAVGDQVEEHRLQARHLVADDA